MVAVPLGTDKSGPMGRAVGCQIAAPIVLSMCDFFFLYAGERMVCIFFSGLHYHSLADILYTFPQLFKGQISDEFQEMSIVCAK